MPLRFRKEIQELLPGGRRPGAALPPLSDEIAVFALNATAEAGPVKDGPRFGIILDWLITGRRRGGRTLLERFEAERSAGLSAEERAGLADP